jgi:hypothetical protein
MTIPSLGMLVLRFAFVFIANQMWFSDRNHCYMWSEAEQRNLERQRVFRS